MTVVNNTLHKKNADDNRPLCTRCGEPIIYGQKELHIQHCKDCGNIFCLIHDCRATQNSAGKVVKENIYGAEFNKKTYAPMAHTQVEAFSIQQQLILLPEVPESILVDNFLKLLRDKNTQEFTIRIMKIE